MELLAARLRRLDLVDLGGLSLAFGVAR